MFDPWALLEICLAIVVVMLLVMVAGVWFASRHSARLARFMDHLLRGRNAQG
jgi:hypothetical protein